MTAFEKLREEFQRLATQETGDNLAARWCGNDSGGQWQIQPANHRLANEFRLLATQAGRALPDDGVARLFGGESVEVSRWLNHLRDSKRARYAIDPVLPFDNGSVKDCLIGQLSGIIDASATAAGWLAMNAPAEALAQAFGPLLEQMFQRNSETGHGTRDDSTEAEAALTQLRAAYAAAMDENGERIVAIAADTTKSADERMRRISEIDCRVYAWPSSQCADLLHVTDAAIRQTDWWKVDRVRHNKPE